MSITNARAIYTSSVKWTAVTAWAANTAYTVGQLRRQLATPTVAAEKVFMCVVAGTSHLTTEPTWSSTVGETTTDNTVTWQDVTGWPAVNGDMTNCPTWLTGAKSTNCHKGHIIQNNAGTHVFIATNSANAGVGSEPSFSTTLGATTVDGSVTWRCIGPAGTWGAWAAPCARLGTIAMAANRGSGSSVDITSGNILRFYVGSDHAETQNATYTWQSAGGSTDAPPVDILCVNVAGSMPPVAADITTGASIATTGSFAINISGSFRVCYGITFIGGDSTANGALVLAGGNGADAKDKLYKNCTFQLRGSSVNARIGAALSTSFTRFEDCHFVFSSTSQCFGTVVHWEIVGGTIAATGTVPTNIFNTAQSGARWVLRGVDLTAFSGKTLISSTSYVGNEWQFIDCKLPASYTPATMFSADGTSARVHIIRSSSSALDHTYTFQNYSGTINASTTVYRDGGAADAAQGYSWKLVPASTMFNVGYLQTLPMASYNATTATTVTVTFFGIIDAAAVPTDFEVWAEVDYCGSASSPQSTRKSSFPATVLTAATNLTADSSSDWDDGATARANTTAYVLGDVIKLASNTGRIFFCTVAGTTAGSEPAGYASAVDGGSVVDNTATFRAGCRFSFTVTLSSPNPEIAGVIYSQLKYHKYSTTVYFDPKPVLS